MNGAAPETPSLDLAKERYIRFWCDFNKRMNESGDHTPYDVRATLFVTLFIQAMKTPGLARTLMSV